MTIINEADENSKTNQEEVELDNTTRKKTLRRFLMKKPKRTKLNSTANETRMRSKNLRKKEKAESQNS